MKYRPSRTGLSGKSEPRNTAHPGRGCLGSQVPPIQDGVIWEVRAENIAISAMTRAMSGKAKGVSGPFSMAPEVFYGSSPSLPSMKLPRPSMKHQRPVIAGPRYHSPKICQKIETLILRKRATIGRGGTIVRKNVILKPNKRTLGR